MSSIRGQLVAITGAGSGIGRATARLLASQGALLSLSDIDGERLKETLKELEPLVDEAKHPDYGFAPVIGKNVDVRSSEQVDKWIEATLSHFKDHRLAGAANIAGVVGSSYRQESGLVYNVQQEEWDFVLDINLKGVANCLRAQLPVMKEGEKGRGGGSVVNISSVAGLVGLPANSPYITSKHAIIGLTRAASQDMGEKGVRVNAVAPGIIETTIVANLRDKIDKRYSRIPPTALQRNGDPEEVAQVIAFLLSDQASYVNGAIIRVDGGMMV